MLTTQEILKKAKEVSPLIARTSEQERNNALTQMANALEEEAEYILEKNSVDVELAKDRLGSVMIDRLKLTVDRIKAMADGLREVALLPDPLKKTYSETIRPNGLLIKKLAVPMGVVAIIYESRPNVTSDASSLALKSGNACILRSGKDAFESASAIVRALKKGLEKASFPTDAIQLIEDKTHASSNELMKANGYVDLLIPRGSARLINACIENATVPCIQTGTGICHIYVDKSADLEMAVKIVNNAKTSRPSVCNACEVCLVHKDIAKEFLPMLKKELIDNRLADGKIAVDIRGDNACQGIIPCTPAGDDDFDTEFLDYILGVKVVSDIEAAVKHISVHSTGHSEAIVSSDEKACDYFTLSVDSSSVYVNASTRFTDGGEFGLGCEMGISTQKLHARGPMGLEELTSYKYVIIGNGQVR